MDKVIACENYQGTACLITDVFMQAKLDGSETYIASLYAEDTDRIFTISVKRREFATYGQALDQVAFWANLYNLTPPAL